MNPALSFLYLIAAIAYISGLKLLGHPKTAKRGNLIAAGGMFLAIGGTLFLYKTVEAEIYALILSAIILGAAFGWLIAKRIAMTKMPELVSLFNGMGGASAALIGLIEYYRTAGALDSQLIVLGSTILGSITLSGSAIAWAKLNGNMQGQIRLPYYNWLNSSVLILIFCLSAYLLMPGTHSGMIYLVFALALGYGVLFVIPIGGADMPVVISLLNAFTGVAAALTGLLFENMAMLSAGVLVGSAGLILTFAMCEAMNRSLFNVVFGAFGVQKASGEKAVNGFDHSVKQQSESDVAILLNYARKVVVVPGYGLAVAQAQHVMHELEQLLEEKDVEVKYAIHPVAGRMPGHMNVLLAETDVAYEKLVEMDDINPEFQYADAVLVVGANDVVNPAAHNDPESPIYGMPILDVVNAKSVIVNKRSMNPGYAGIDNQLFFHQKTSMLFGDAKAVLTRLVQELKAL